MTTRRPRHSKALRNFYRDMYLASRAAGDLNAVQHGRLGRRLVTRAVHRKEVGLLRRWRLW